MIFREISTCEKCEMFQNCESSDSRFLKFCRSSACCGLIIIADLKKWCFDVQWPTFMITRQCVFLLKDSIVILDLLLSQFNKVSSITSPIDMANLNVLSKSKSEGLVSNDIIWTLWELKRAICYFLYMQVVK